MMTQAFDPFGLADLLPLGEAMRGHPPLIAWTAAGDALVAIAFLVIAAAVAVVARRSDLPRDSRRAATLLALGLLAAGLTQTAGLLTLWTPIYGVEALLKVVTAGAATLAAIAVWPQVPRLLAPPAPRDLERANALAEANASLETAVDWRTQELEVANQRFEQALQRSNITVFTQDTDLRYTWIHNPRLGRAADEIVGRTDEEILPPHAADASRALKRRALETGQTVNATVAVATEDEARIYLDMTVSPTLDANGMADGVLCTALDVTEKQLFEVRLAAMAAQLATAYQRFELALENSAITVFEQDAELRYTYVYNPPPGTTPDDFLQRTDLDLFPDAEARKLVPRKQRVLASGEREAFEVEIEIGGELRFFDLRLEAKSDDTGSTTGVVSTAVDLTEHRRDEKRMRLMMRELTHRSKNLLAVIQAMARKTATLSEDTDSFIIDFSSRLQAMAAAHDLLVSQSWHGADLGDLIRASVAQTIAPTAEQVHIEGPALMLAPDTAQNLGLAFHELATNASKYGALAADAGQLAVTWDVQDGEVRIVWKEQGGPEVTRPERRGFGRVLLERLIGATLNGSVDLDFRSAGVVCEIVFPEDRLIAA